MICKHCKAEGEVSQVFVGPSRSTCMWNQPFYDEKGVYHSHNTNTVNKSYSCSRGHMWTENVKLSCPNCDWGK